MAGQLLAHTHKISSTHILLLFESLAILVDSLLRSTKKKSFSFRSNAAGSHSNSNSLFDCLVCVCLSIWPGEIVLGEVAVKMETKQRNNSLSLSVPCASLTSHIYARPKWTREMGSRVKSPPTETKMNKQKRTDSIWKKKKMNFNTCVYPPGKVVTV